MNSLSLSTNYTLEVVKKRFISSRFLTFIILQALIIIYYTSSISKFSQAVNYPVSQWSLPLLYSNPYFLLLLMISIIYYFSDVPFMHHNEMYQIIRVGRMKWAIGKIAGIIIFSFVMPLIQMILVTIPLLGNLQFESNWGKVLYTLSMTNAGFDYQIYFIPDIVKLYTPIRALLTCFLISGLITTTFGLLMYALSLVISRLAAITATSVIVFFSIMSKNLIWSYRWIARISPLSWLDLSNVATKPGHALPGLVYIFTMLISFIIILSIIILVKIKTTNFQWNKED